MGYTHGDVFRLLPAALGNRTYSISDTTISDTTIVCEIGEGSLTITLGPEGKRELGLVVIPKTEIVFEFENLSESQCREFLEYFDLRFMKGLA